MTTKSLEERIQNLEAAHQIQNLMGRYQLMHSTGMYEEMAGLYAQKTPGVRAELEGMGVFEGNAGIRRMLAMDQNIEGDRVGFMTVNVLTTPVIEVAGDGQTAKGVWVSPGICTGVMGSKPSASWRWCKFGADFIKEDGQWKFWHLHAYGLFMTPYERSWAEPAPTPPPSEEPMIMPDEFKADRPNTYRWSYSLTAVTENVPAPPEPYETWDESTSYVPAAQ